VSFAVADIMFKWQLDTSHLQWRRPWYDRSTKTSFERGFRLFFYHGVKLAFSQFELFFT